MSTRLSFAILSCLPILCSAAVYKFFDEEGNLVYSDQPGPDAEEVEMAPISTIKPRQLPSSINQPASASLSATYTQFAISSPTQDETIRDNNGTISVDISIDPPLNQRAGHRILLLLDGNAVSQPVENTAFTLNNVDRGSHTLTASIVDKNDQALISDSVTVHIKRHSIQHPNAQTPRPAQKLSPQSSAP